jgi:multiple sugar transport system ATP-binding protein
LASLSFAAVWKRYGTVEAVRDLNLSCPQGEMLALLGPSGCGKSTTLKMLAGIEDLSEGEIFFDGEPVSQLAPAARNIAMVFEDYALYPRMTVRENIAFPLRVRGVPQAEASERIEQVLALLQLTKLADANVRGLSGGAQQRVSIGRALVRDPRVILLDEPLSHLDADQKVQLRTEIKRLQQLSRVTSILVTHDQTEATAMADRIAVMAEGVLQQVGSPEDLYERPANLFVAGFIGEPPMNLIPVEATTRNDDIVLSGRGVSVRPGERIGTRLKAHPRPELILGVRPEHVAVSASAGEGTSAEIRYREPRGDSEILTIAPAGGDTLITEVPGPSGYRPGDAVFFSFSDRAHLFDARSGRNLMAP